MPDIYKYNKSIDKKVAKAVAKILKTEVTSCTKFPKGEINHVYKVETAKGAFVARVFRYKDWPEKEKLPWIEKQLEKAHIPHAKNLYYSKGPTYFPNGFMIQTYIEGLLGTEAMKTKLITEQALYKSLGEIASKLHQIRLSAFGSPVDKKRQNQDFTKKQVSSTAKILDNLLKEKVLPLHVVNTAKSIISKELELRAKNFQPVLLHGDMSPSNVIVGKDKKLYLIDWDNARAGIWPAEYIELSRRHLLGKMSEENKACLKKSFYKGYGEKSLTAKELARLEDVLMIIRQIWQMHYYYFDRKEKTNFLKIRKIFYSLLKNSK